ncbi:hypothetical protein, partial [Paraburkholderia mimosarum]|uniref:hypothetical protein n=1 Tax=Paraburkholderia mimosarum TaxID=312026 RepID=UPI001ABB3512
RDAHPQGGGSGSALRCHARDVDGQNVVPLFNVLKNACRVEALQLSQMERVEKALALGFVQQGMAAVGCRRN